MWSFVRVQPIQEAVRLLPALILAVVPLWAAQGRIEGSVHGDRGEPIAKATVLARSDRLSGTAQTDAAGRFEIPFAADSANVSVTAAGFVPAEIAWDANRSTPLEIVLRALRERVVVSATRIATRVDEAPGSSVLLSRDDVQATPALMTDDLLRQIPGFTLFRRQSSRFANPTSFGRFSSLYRSHR